MSADRINNILLEYYEINRDPDEKKREVALEKLEKEVETNPEITQFLDSF